MTNLLIVDDTDVDLMLMEGLLNAPGFTIVTAGDGFQALEKIDEWSIDLILTDLQMPRMDGFEVAKNVRSSSRLKDLPIIMITSRTGDKHRERAMSLKVNRYMGKPFQEEILLANIRALSGEADQSQ